jgi:hypothetical protein
MLYVTYVNMCLYLFYHYHICSVMVRVLSAVDCGPQSGKTKDYKIYICYFSVKHATLRSKSKDWLAQNQDNVLECSNMCTCGLVSVS